MSWEKDDCELSALKKSLESQAVGMASLAARLRTVECNVEQQLYANKGLKSALVKLASREAATRSQVYATLERMEVSNKKRRNVPSLTI